MFRELTHFQFCAHCFYYLGIPSEFTKVIGRAEQIFELTEQLREHGVQIYFDPIAWKFFRQYKRMIGAK